LSVAMLPAAGAAVASSQSAAPAGMSMTDDMDCCPHKANPCDDCATMATCALKCFSFAETSSATIVFPSTSAKMTATFASNPFSSQAGSPPFRPPRV
jgi:Tfp pilus assembly protein PilW